MYRIDEKRMDQKYILLIPAMLDWHFPLLKYAFYSQNYHPVVLENEENLVDIGLKYVNNDMCYPIVLIVGQMIAALQSGKYDPKRTRLLMPSAGDACRGSNYTGVLRRAVAKAGFTETKVLSLNLKGLEKGEQLHIEPGMIWRALFALFYGDILMMLVHQTRPNELVPGESQRIWRKWVGCLADDLKEGKHLTIAHMKKNFKQIAEDFAQICLQSPRKQRVGIVGEIYIKYCHLGNGDLIRYLEEQGCESHTNGLSWYVMYYMDSHLTQASSVEARLYKAGMKFFASIQDAMILSMREKNFYVLERFSTCKEEAKEYVSFQYNIGDGWLIGAEVAGHALHGCPKVVAVQPFGCMVNHCCGRGLYPSLQRRIKDLRLVSVDVDASGAESNVYNRVQMLIDQKH